MTTLFIATANGHKVQEIRALLGSDYVVLSQRDTEVRLEPEETGSTFAENAGIKSVTWASYLAMDECGLGADFVLADDSGLEVDALGGAPGVHSARFAALDDGRKGNSPDAENNAKLMRLLSAVPEGGRTARFRCVLALTPVTPGLTPDALADATRCFDGACDGRIATGAVGQGGFGYDPLFVPDGYPASFAELGEAVKNQLSHRAKALAKLRSYLDPRPAGPTR